MRKLLVIVFMVVLMVCVQIVTVNSFEETVLCCWFCGPCNKSKCEAVPKSRCDSENGKIVTFCSECETLKNQSGN